MDYILTSGFDAVRAHYLCLTLYFAVELGSLFGFLNAIYFFFICTLIIKKQKKEC